MAPENKKRKGAVDSAPKPKKQKKVDDAATTTKSSAKALKAAVAPIDDLAVKVKATRKRAADFFDDAEQKEPTEPKAEKKEKKSKKAKVVEDTDDAATIPEPTEKPKKSKKAKAVEEEAVIEQPTTKTKRSKKEVAASKDEAEVSEPAEKPKRSKKTKVAEDTAVTEQPAVKAKKAKKETVPAETPETAASVEKKSKKAKSTKKQKEASPEPVESEEEDFDDEDDQTAALLAGFESDRDESDLEKEDDGEVVPTAIPKAAKKSLAKIAHAETDEPGVIYIGRIPHGFYEPQMKAYFKQFGDVTRLRLSRNKKTGASKHYAFVEFASADVAEIVAKTMNNYLMFGHILQCKVIPTERVHEDLFKGANHRFKQVPRNTIAAREFERGATRDVWEKRVEKKDRKRAKEAKILKEQLGYEYAVPKLKNVDEVPKKGTELLDGATQQLLLEAPTEVIIPEEVTKPKKSKKTKTKA